jgi:hypothetical protein
MSFVKNLRGALQQSFLSLPLILSGWSLFMGVTQGNIGLLVLSLGQVFAVPLLTVLSNTLMEQIVKRPLVLSIVILIAFASYFAIPSEEDVENIGNTEMRSLPVIPTAWAVAGVLGLINHFMGADQPGKNWFTVPNGDVCNIVPGKTDFTIPSLWVAPSHWMAQVVFFFSFLISSAGFIYGKPAEENADKEKVARRKAQSLTSLILTSVSLVALVGIRKTFVGCETWAGIATAFLTMGTVGYGWYFLARLCSARDADIFGIVQKILPPSARDPPPMTCVYTG